VKTLLCVLCFLCGPVFSFGLDRHAFTFTDYDLTVTLDPAKSGFSAQGTVTLRNDTGEPQKLAVLQVSSTLDWRAITVGGKAVQYVSQLYTSDIDHTGALSEAIVTLPSALLPNQSVKLDIAYAGTIAQDATRLTRIGVPEKLAARSDWDRIAGAYGALRGVGYVAWYPIATEAQSLSDGSSVFREIGAWRQREAAASMRVALAGADHTLHTTGSPAPGCSESKAECSTWNPVGWSVPALLYGVYQELARPGSEIAYLPGRQPLAEDYARVITQITPFVAQWFGTPSRPVRIFEVAWPDSASWESGAMLLTPLKQSLPDPLQLELVHQVTHAVLRSPRPWIFEGAAEFAQALERERQAGRRAGIAFMEAQSSPLTAAQRFTALQSGEIDVLSRVTTVTFQRDVQLGIEFPAIDWYDGTGFLVRRTANVRSAKDLDGATICVQPGTSTELDLADYFRKNHLRFTPVVIERLEEGTAAYFSGRCDALSLDRSSLASIRARATTPADHVVLAEVISKSPFGPGVMPNDLRWMEIVRWSVYATIDAEELGLSSKTIQSALESDDPGVQRFVGTSGGFGAMLGLDSAWALRIVRQVGNYAEIFDRNIRPLGVDRGLNRLWKDGGVFYVPDLN